MAFEKKKGGMKKRGPSHFLSTRATRPDRKIGGRRREGVTPSFIHILLANTNDVLNPNKLLTKMVNLNHPIITIPF